MAPNDTTVPRMKVADKRFLIVLPVRNGGEYVKLCLASILAQTYANFRLVVLDNASEDGTTAHVRGLGDPRISLQVSPTALSIEKNWQRIIALDGDETFLTIIGHDDLLDPQFLARMSALIDAHPVAGLYHARFRLIDARGRRIRSASPGPVLEQASEFLAARLAFGRDSYGTGYVCRLSDYRRVGGIQAYPQLMFADDALWLTLMQGSYKASETQESFSYRLHRASISGSPPWKPTYAALNAYLNLLAELSKGDAAMAQVLRAGIGNYLLYWYRWAYFEANVPAAERSDMRHQIDELSARIRALFGADVARPLETSARTELSSGLPRARWFLWRVRNHLWRRVTG